VEVPDKPQSFAPDPFDPARLVVVTDEALLVYPDISIRKVPILNFVSLARHTPRRAVRPS
jgi:hypothetical protein